MRSPILILLALWVLATAACAGDEGDAAFVYVPAAALSPTLDAGGPTGITVVRAVDGAEGLGAYPLPARIPVSTAGGARDIRLEPVVRRAGVAERLTAYPMYGAALAPAPTTAGATDTVRPRFGLAEGTRVILADSLTFGLTSFAADLDADTATAFVRVADGEGAAFARAAVTEDSPVLEATTEVIALASDASELWLELDYRGEALLRLALIPSQPEEAARRGMRYLQGAFGRDRFERFYFDLGDPVEDPAGAALLAARTFRVAALAVYDPAGPSVQRAEIDNVRLLAR